MSINYRRILIWGLSGTYFYKDKNQRNQFIDLVSKVLIEKYKIDLPKEKIKEMAINAYREESDFTLPFVKEYGLDSLELSQELFKNIPVDEIEFDNASDLLNSFPQEQYILTKISKYWAEKLLKKLDLYDFFKDRVYYHEEFLKNGCSNEQEIYEAFCNELFVKPQDCIIIEDVNFRLKKPKEMGFNTIKISVSESDYGDGIYYDKSYKTIDEFIADM